MRAKSRNRIHTGDTLTFTDQKKSYEWYWDHDWKFLKDPVVIIDYKYADTERPDSLTLTFIYLDLDKKFHPTESIEYVDSHEFKIPEPQMEGKAEVDFIIKEKIENKLIWKVILEVKTNKAKSYLCLSVTDSVLRTTRSNA